ncbi:hypothetical protein U9M48_000645 [Paspalum notatum var. saurae]|uniref:Uncharacterized protein n=1 Tax=Paspalum notatum var. saurae TaxID=547442 RepID=A0AAQ3PKI7_PASNO
MHCRDEEYRVPFKFHVRYDEKKELAEKLKSKLDAPEVIPVVGVGGVGKRALLRHAYEDFKEYNFNVRILVSFPPDVVETSMMVKQVEETLNRECRSLCNNELATKKDARYLVVIGSPVNSRTWSKLAPSLLGIMAGKAGIKVLVPVTSSPDDVQGSGIKMKALVNRESVTLFNKAYGLKRKGTNYQTMEMNKIRDNIMEITGGHPLAVVLLAKLMRTMDLNKWEAAAEYMKSSNEDSKLQSIVSVCVDDLPDELKSCLLFTAGFPVSKEIDAQQVVRLWMAEGFLTQHHELETERLGQCYLRELIYRGLLQLVLKTTGSSHGEGGGGCRVERVAIHDQIHPLLISEAQRTSFMDIHYGGCIPAPSNTRRLALHRYNNKFDAFSNGLGKLRTVVSYYSESDHPEDSSKREDKKPDTQVPTLNMRDLCRRSPYLRVINLEGIHIVDGKLPTCIGEMVHLQYLGVRIPNLEELPSSVGNLSQLQTIDVRGTKVHKLPKRVWKIKTLRHVLGDCLAFPWSTGDDDLKLMQTLEGVTIKATPAKTTKQRGKIKSRSGGSLVSLQRLHVVELEESQLVALATILKDLSSSLNSLKLSGRRPIPITNLFAGASGPCLRNVESLELDGELTTEHQVPHQHASEENHCYCYSGCLINSRILNRLTRLVLRSTGIKQDFITHAISKLPDLDELELQDGSYEGSNLVLCSHAFRTLKVVRVSGLPELKEIVVDDHQVMVMAYQHVKTETHKSCHDCPKELVGPQNASSPAGPNQNKGNNGDGVSSHARTEEGANQSPLIDIEKKILAAVDTKGSSETAIKDYIKKKYGDSVHQHLEHMVHTNRLGVTRARYDKYYLPEAKPAEPQRASSPADLNTNKKNNGDGGSPDVNQSPLLKQFEERILEAIDSNASSKTAIKAYIKAKYGDIVHEHLNLMVRSHKLRLVTVRGGYDKYYRPSDGPQEQGEAGAQEQGD